MNITKAEERSFLVLDEATNELVFAITVGNTESEASLIGQRVPLGQGIIGLAAMTREVRLGRQHSPDITQVHNPLGEPKSVLAAPILAGDNVFGVITAVSFKAESRFSGRHADTYAGFASLVGTVVERRRLAMYESGDARFKLETELT
jgi:sigma-B regulation protein RsbU (phosphoserine phosphatase)